MWKIGSTELPGLTWPTSSVFFSQITKPHTHSPPLLSCESMPAGTGICGAAGLFLAGSGSRKPPVMAGAMRGIPTACRAVILPRFGGSEVLELHPSFPLPDLKPREVLVRARAVSVNPLDTRVSVGYPSFLAVLISAFGLDWCRRRGGNGLLILIIMDYCDAIFGVLGEIDCVCGSFCAQIRLLCIVCRT